MRVAVDAAGGDNAPLEVVKGCLQALHRLPELETILVGDRDRLTATLRELDAPTDARCSIEHAPEVVGMHEAPAASLRSKKRSSVRVAVELVSAGRADAVFSAGNTGAFVAAAQFLLRPLPGVRRGGIAVSLPTLSGGVSVMMDVGANIAPKPSHLVQYAVMASVFCKDVYEIEEPRVGLLNIGGEEGKGTELYREVSERIQSAGLNFAGNVEGQELFCGKVDVIVCDGFTGNAVLKVAEGAGLAVYSFVERYLRGRGEADEGLLSALHARVDFEEYGGAPLLGVAGIPIVGHGRSNAKAVASALEVASRCARRSVPQHLVQALEALAEPSVPG